MLAEISLLTVARDEFRQSPGFATLESLLQVARQVRTQDLTELTMANYLAHCPEDPAERFAYFTDILEGNRSWSTPVVAREWGVVFARITVLYAAEDFQTAFAWTAMTMIFEKDRLAGSFAERIQAADALRRARDRGVTAAASGPESDIRYHAYQMASESLTTFLPSLAEDSLDRTLLDEAISIGEEQLSMPEPSFAFGYTPAYSNTASASIRRYEWAGKRADLDRAVEYSSTAADRAWKLDRFYRYRKQKLAFAALAKRFIEYQQESDLRAALGLAGACVFGTRGVDKWAFAAICKLELLSYAYDLSPGLTVARKALKLLLDEIPDEPETRFLSIVVDLFTEGHVETGRVDSVLTDIQDEAANLAYALRMIQGMLSPPVKVDQVPLVGGPIELRPLILIPFSKIVDVELARLAAEAASRPSQ